MKNKKQSNRSSAKKSRSKRQRRQKKGRSRSLNFEALESRVLLATVTVGTAADLLDGDTSSITSLIASPGADGAISLREAIAATDSTLGSDTITFDAGVFNGEAADVIRLQSPISIIDSVAIDGGGLGVVVSGDSSGNDALAPGSFITDIDASGPAGTLSDNTDGVFALVGGREAVAISGLTITGGVSSESGGGISATLADLTLSQTIVSGNFAQSAGGGVAFATSPALTSAPVLTIDQSTISDNSVISFSGLSSARGGGIASSFGDVFVSNSTISGNVADGESGEGGGIFSNSGLFSLTSSTVSGNVAASPFGASAGGGLFLGSQSAVVTDSTITQNTADFGGGLAAGGGFVATTIDLENSIVAGNTAVSNSADAALGFSVSLDASFSLIGDNSGVPLAPTSGGPDAAGNLVGSALNPIDPQLESLADNGGPTLTHALLPSSPAFDAGNSILPTDQTGASRVIGRSSDIGAFELQGTFLVVDTSEGFFDGDFSDGDLSLSEAIEISNSTSEIETIIFDAAVFNGEFQDVIRLQNGVVIAAEVTIDAQGLDIVVSGDADGNDARVAGSFITDVGNNFSDFDNSRPIVIDSPLTDLVTLRGLTVTGGAAGFTGQGGGILVGFGNLLLEDSVVAGNVAADSGGGIAIEVGELTIRNSTVSQNFVATGFEGGGGVYAFDAEVLIDNSTISENSAQVGGGVFSEQATLTIIDSQISDNFASDAGAGVATLNNDLILNRSTVSNNQTPFGAGGGIITELGSITVSSSTISGNSAGQGAGIRTGGGILSVIDSTIANNQASNVGGGILLEAFFANTPADFIVENSIIADNTQGGDIFEGTGSFFFSFDVRSSLIGSENGNRLTGAPVGTPDTNGNLIGFSFSPIDPLLGDLADNGGPTETHALLPGSPAIDAGSSSALTDQRGQARPNFGGVGPDIGAFEEQALTLVVDTSNDFLDGDFSVGNRSLREAIERANANEGLDTILFDDDVFDGQFEDVIRLVNGEIAITDSVVISTDGVEVVVSGDALGNDVFNTGTFIVDIASSDVVGTLADNSRVFNIDTAAGETVSLTGLTITGGANGAGGGGGILISSAVVDLNGVNISGNQSNGAGGGVRTDSDLTLNNSDVSSNVASSRGSGGGIAAGSGNLTLEFSTVNNNLATAFRGGGISTTTGDVLITGGGVSNNTLVGGSRGGGIGTTSGDVTIVLGTISNNSGDFEGGGIYTDSGVVTLNRSSVSGNQSDTGGGIFTESGTVSLTESSVTNNSASGNSANGGGVSTGTGNILLTESTVSGNSSADSGGGLYTSAGNVIITSSTVSGNSGSFGGGLFLGSGDATISSSTFSGNSGSANGGGLYVSTGQATFTNSTVSGNDADRGGGVFVRDGEVSIFSSTLAFNESLLADGGGGLFNENDSAAATFEIQSSIVASNTAAGVASDLRFDSALPLDLDFSLIGTNANTPLIAAPVGSADANGNQIGTSASPIDPQLLGLANYGGLTQTHALLATSPAIDSGSSAQAADQRGFPFLRDDGNGVDVGAVEFQALQLVVGATGDVANGNFVESNLTLREAVELTNANPGEDFITFAANQFRGFSADTIHLIQGELTITESVNIDGEDLNIVISGDRNRDDFNVSGTDITDLSNSSESRLDDNSGVFNITAAAGELITLSGLTITGGVSTDFGGITNGAADLVISDSDISGNRTSGSGAGISNDSGLVTLSRSTVSGNQTLDDGGSGGGIYSNTGDVSLQFSTVSGNQTSGANAAGGGIHTVDGSVSLTLSTVSGNQALGTNSDGGGVSSVNGELTLESVTVANNTAAGFGGGLFVADSFSNPAFTLQNSIVADNNATGAPDLSFDPNGSVDVQFSLIGDGTGSGLAAAPIGSADSNGNLVGATGSAIDPLLGELADFNGPTLTHELLAGSPAIGVGSSSLATDQRDDAFFARDNGDGVDIGAFERYFFDLVVDTASDANDGILSPGNLSLREALALSNLNPIDDVISFDPAVFNGEQADVIRLDLESLTISDGVIIDAGTLGVVISGDIAGDDILVPGTNLTDTFASDDSDTLDDNIGVIEVTATAGEVVSITGLTITGGVSDDQGGGIFGDEADLVLTDVLIAGNRSGIFDDGGGIFSDEGSVTLNQSIVSGNHSDDQGGGIFTDEGAISINESTVSGNVSDDDGGGIASDDGLVVITDSTVENNTTESFGNGGGVYARAGGVTLIGSSVNNNVTEGSSGNGGGVYTSSGDVTVVDSVVNNNSTGRTGDGGGIYSSSGDITLTDSTVANNTTDEDGDGGGIFNSSGDVTLTNSTIANNIAGDDGDGGGIHTSSGDVTALRSTISGNQSGEDGGAVETFFGDIVFINSTISGNQSTGNGGAFNLQSGDLLHLLNSTVTNNQSGGDGGGFRFFSTSSFDDLIIENSIVAGNVTTGGIGPDAFFTSDIDFAVEFSLIGDQAGTPLSATGPSGIDANGNRIGSAGDLVDPLLDVLADNGGPTLTHALLVGSPALNAGGSPDSQVGSTDQRGLVRVRDGQIDIGAVEGIRGPQVVDVLVSGSTFSANFIDAIDGSGIGSGNGLGYSLVGDNQLTTVPWQGIDTLHLQFSTDVSESFVPGSVLLTGTNGGDYVLTPVSYTPGLNIATYAIPSGIGNDSLVISIFPGAVTDNSFNPLVGDLGDQFNFRFNVLPGDVDGSGQVNSEDVFVVSSSLTDLTTPNNFRHDIDGSGQINSVDAFTAFANVTNGLPPEPVAPQPPLPVLSVVAAPVIETASSEEVVGEEVVAEEIVSKEATSEEVRVVVEPDAIPSAPQPQSVVTTPAIPVIEATFSDDFVIEAFADQPDALPTVPRPVATATALSLPVTEASFSQELLGQALVVDAAAPAAPLLPQPVALAFSIPAIDSVSSNPLVGETPQRRSIELAPSNARPERTLAGHIDASSVEVDERDYSVADTETSEKLRAVELDSFFAGDLNEE